MASDPGTKTAAPERESSEAARTQRQRDLELTMSERLERLHRLCKQASQLGITGTRSG